MINEKFLDEGLCEKLREAINASPIFRDDEKYNWHFNLICAVMDRLDTSIKYLNNHCNYPDSEEDFICFIVFSCMVVDGVKKLIENVTQKKLQHESEKKFFKKYCMDAPMCCTEEECPTDDRFFEHFRSLTFAHPYETNRNKVFREKFGMQVSPWVSANKYLFSLYHFSEPVGVKVYTEKKDEDGCDTKSIMVSFKDLKDYIASRYNEITVVIEWAKSTKNNTENEWKKIKINRAQQPTDILKEIKKLQEQRYQETYTIQEIISYVECEISDIRNLNAVCKYRKYIYSKIDALCDSVDELNIAQQEDIESSMTYFPLANTHPGFHYQIEKIFSYLRERNDLVDPGSDEEWGLKQALNFYNEFAYKWVYMDLNNMSYEEIRLLVIVACYLEAEKNNMSN